MSIERKIGGHVYRCEKLPAEPAIKLFTRAGALFRETPMLLSSVAFGEDSARAAFLGLAMSGANPDEVQSLLKDLVEICTTGGNPCVLGVKPQNLEDMVDVAWFAMEAQFKDFLVGSLPPSLREEEAAGADAA